MVSAGPPYQVINLKCTDLLCLACWCMLQVDSGTWSVPDLLPGPSPGARAFHCAVALGQRLLLFGGHILTFDAEHNRKRRTFFNDVWQLDTVRAKHCLTSQRWPNDMLPTRASQSRMQQRHDRY
jgi:hypothetical protein